MNPNDIKDIKKIISFDAEILPNEVIKTRHATLSNIPNDIQIIPTEISNTTANLPDTNLIDNINQPNTQSQSSLLCKLLPQQSSTCASNSIMMLFGIPMHTSTMYFTLMFIAIGIVLIRLDCKKK